VRFFRPFVEALVFALFFTALIVGLRGDLFLTGTLAIVVLGQSALLPFLSLGIGFFERVSAILTGGTAAFGLIVLGLYRTLRRVGGVDFLDRLALLSLLAVLPQATLWLTLKLAYPFFDVRLLLMRLLPLYLAATIAAVLPARFSEADLVAYAGRKFWPVRRQAGLLIIAISLSASCLKRKVFRKR